jgi:glyoxylase-like metal-dependent hydrolase (beta-lactamase superfamily II)
MRILTFTGGIYDTNCYFIEDHAILIDAPQGSAEWLDSMGKKAAMLLLTHAHIDHVIDAARLARTHGCQVACHRDAERMLVDKDFFRRFGFELEIEPVQPDLFIEETPSQHFNGLDLQVLFVPGHCPGSLCFFEKNDRVLFGGDVLFAGSIGRTDLPGGDHPLLISGIKNKLFPLGDNVKVLSGHGPLTTIGRERKTNPFLS